LLDGSGLIPSALLPSYVDDVLEYANLGAFPGTGTTGKIYVAIDTNKTYRWSGSVYVEISASPGSTDAVTEGATNLYFTAARVRSTVLTGLSLATNAAITASDTVLSAFGKLQKQVTDLIAAALTSSDIGATVQAYSAQLFTGVPQNSKSAAYTLVAADANKHILHPSADTTARIFTIPANASVAFPVGTAITFVNQNGAGVVTIAITTDTMRLAGVGTTGSRTLAANGMATALKVTSTEWIISGSGLA
jgi:hypothetical protein